MVTGKIEYDFNKAYRMLYTIKPIYKLLFGHFVIILMLPKIIGLSNHSSTQVQKLAKMSTRELL